MAIFNSYVKLPEGKTLAVPRILYTSSVPDELDHQTALHALDVAHRWQAQVVVVILTNLLTGAGARPAGKI